MLNIKTLTASNVETYYTDAITTGVEDYYLRDDTPAGVWIASSEVLLGMSGEVDPAALTAVLDDRDPASGVRLGLADNRTVRGFDLTFRAPKSVSVAWAFAPPDIAVQVVAAHSAAVEAAVGFLERQACSVRRGRNGLHVAAGGGFIAAAFVHRTSRAEDPLLHTHVVVANSTMTVGDREWRTLDSRRVFAHAKTAGYLYQAQLRYELTQRFGVAWSPVVNGTAELETVPAGLRDLFSKRRAAIEAELASNGHSGARAAQYATLATRPAKITGTTDADLRDGWQTEAHQAGHAIPVSGFIAAADLTRNLTRNLTHRVGPSVETLAGLLSAPDDGLTAKRSTFTRNDLLRGLCDQHRDGATINHLERHARHVVADPRFVQLKNKTIHGHPTPTHTTKELLDLERLTIHIATTNPTATRYPIPTSTLADATRPVPGRSVEQVTMIRTLLTSDRAVDLVIAPAGAGKTTALAAAVHAWQQTGIPVVGVALSGRAADELATATRIPASTIAALRGTWARGEQVAYGSVLIVDEAAMAGTRDLAALIHHASTRNARVVLVGDPKQLPSIDAGGILTGLARRQPVIELHDNHRQQAIWEQLALSELRDGNPDAALAAYQAHHRIHTAPTRYELIEQIVGQWWNDRQTGQPSIMIAATRNDVDALNRLARQHAHTTGHIHGPAITAAGRDYQPGDEIICLKNNQRLGIRNGTRGTITHIGATIEFTTTDGKQRTLPQSYLEAGNVDHGYAFTIHKTQGMTATNVHALVDDTLYRELAYTGLSRGTTTNHLYILPNTQLGDHLQTLTHAIKRTHAQTLALETALPTPTPATPTAPKPPAPTRSPAQLDDFELDL